MFEQPIKRSNTIPMIQKTLQIIASLAAPRGSTSNRLTRKPPNTIPTQAPGIAHVP
jgi:hypothetical protein